MKDLKQLSKIQEAVLSEFLTIGYGEIKNRLASYFKQKIEFALPKWNLCDRSDIDNFFSDAPKLGIIIEQAFEGGYSGTGFLVIDKENIQKVISFLQDKPEEISDLNKLTADQKDLLKEIGNITINGLICSVDNFLDDEHEFQLPTCFMGMPQKILKLYDYKSESFPILVMHSDFEVGTEKLNIIIGLVIGSQGMEVLIDTLENKLSTAA